MTADFQSTPLRWRALTTRNPAAHASFVYAVLTTRIYCRPTCPARLARRANIVFYDCAAAAAADGFRACLRCRPGERSEPHGERREQSSPSGPGGKVVEGTGPDGDVEDGGEMHAARNAAARARAVLERERGAVVWRDVAARVGRSPRYLHEAFKRAYGVTPGVFAAGLRGEAQAVGGEVVVSAAEDEVEAVEAPGVVEVEGELGEWAWENLILWEPVTFDLRGQEQVA